MADRERDARIEEELRGFIGQFCYLLNRALLHFLSEPVLLRLTLVPETSPRFRYNSNRNFVAKAIAVR